MYTSLALQEIINTPVLDYFKQKLSKFSSINEDVEDFIRNKAIEYEMRQFSRTYLILDDVEIAAYFTLALKTLFFTDDVSNTKKKAIHGLSNKINDVPVVLIGQLSKNFMYTGNFTGEELLNYALDVVYQVQKLVGGRICLVETLADDSNEKVMDFYLHNGFIKLQKDTDGIYQQLIRKL
ncbi:MAG: hypothetical protein IJ736_06965 [Firmicutes bacterium]|nr:hypothetical protein [Bacillota bacterium]